MTEIKAGKVADSGRHIRVEMGTSSEYDREAVDPEIPERRMVELEGVDLILQREPTADTPYLLKFW